MSQDPTSQPLEARMVQAERYIQRLRIGLIAVASLIIWQATSAMGWLGPVRIYASEVYASRYVLEDADQKVHGRWEVDEERPARLSVFGPGAHYQRLDADGLTRRVERDLPEAPAQEEAPAQ